ncbi:MAG: valine--tRNA ligase, partial [Candidatus Absconditabacteria bacterium]|nr:valine--tRNA ligase [Candidatus Absconditabacteria bacterium]
MANKYNFQESEAKWQKFWEDHQTNAFDISDTNLEHIYSIDTPPPTVSGKLHIGHIFSYTQAEIIARYKRMKGFNVFYPMGYDDNGIPTEQLVERELKVNIREMERKEFVQKCLEVNQKYRDIYKTLRQSLGFSIDRKRTYATISPEVQQLVQKRFVEMYKAGHIVSKQFPSLWCTKNQTTIAQAETEEKEFNEFFNYLNFTLENGEKLVIATTRPEMLPACVCVFVHPEDERFTKYVGQTITTPLGKAVPLLADDKVKMDKGTGVVMCCTYGDEVDMFWVQKHNLPEKIIISRYGKIEHSDCAVIEGLKIEEARERIMEYLQTQPGIVVKRDPIIQSKKISERGKVPVEIIPVYQWFVNILDKKELLLEQNEKMARYPEFMKKRSNDWINNLERDWNISRSRTFGIPVPVWYHTETKEIILPSEAQLEKGFVDPTSMLPEGYSAEQVEPETLVLDTWFTSGLSPLINEQFLKRDGRKGERLLPMSLRPQAHDIIRTWLLYTTLQSYLRTGEIPFKEVMISGHVLAGKSEKISKSTGNAKVEPESLIKQRGADAIRYRTASGQLGKDMVFDEEELKKGQKLVTKLWNAFQFMKMQLEGWEGSGRSQDYLYPTDQRILGRLQETINKMHSYLDAYEYGLAKIAFEEFFWSDFCDNYLELIKVRLYKPELFENGEVKKNSGQKTLHEVFYKIIQLIAPYLPHVTEEIYQEYFVTNIHSIHKTPYPTTVIANETQGSAAIQTAMEATLEVVELVRRYKSESQISMGAELSKIIISCSSGERSAIEQFSDDLLGVTKAKNIEWI